MQGFSRPSLTKCITLLTLLYSTSVFARPGLVPEYYTVVNGKQSFLSVALEDATTGPNNQGGPAVSTAAASMVVVYQTVTASAVVTQMQTVMATKAKVSAVPLGQASNGVIVVSSVESQAAATSVAPASSIVAVAPSVSIAPVAASSVVVSMSTVTTSVPVAAVPAPSTVSSVSVVTSTSPAAATTPAAQGGVFIQQPASSVSSAVTFSVAGSVFTTTLSVQTSSVSLGLPTVTHSAIATAAATANPNLPCYGSNDVLTAFEQANIGSTPLQYQIKNSCPYSVWPVATYHLWPNSGSVTYFDVGELKAYGGTYTWADSPYWMTSARMWAKEGCDANGNNCIVDAGNAPTLFEWTIYPDALAQCATEINYDISLVDGHTIPIAITFDKSTCPSRTCTASKTVNGTCPTADLNRINGVVEGCLSSCSYLQSIGVFSGDAFELACCTGAHNTAETCPATSGWFAAACPEAYSYAYDDVAANRACALPGVVTIEYCPLGSVP